MVEELTKFVGQELDNMKEAEIKCYLNGRDISNRKGVTDITGQQVSYRVVTDNDLWPSRFFKNRKDAENYIGIYKENNVPKSRNRLRREESCNRLLCMFQIDRTLYKRII